ncbi:MAG: hypothetical protein MMC23_009432 [Stictis urceolatum]|nr:hypothetical protein [Stictis urceolata]
MSALGGVKNKLDETTDNPSGGAKPVTDLTQPNKSGDPAKSNSPDKTPQNQVAPARQSRIQDRPKKDNEKDSSLKIKIELDLEVEVELYARVKGDVTIGLL